MPNPTAPSRAEEHTRAMLDIARAHLTEALNSAQEAGAHVRLLTNDLRAAGAEIERLKNELTKGAGEKTAHV
jgi:hypothetical protein